MRWFLQRNAGDYFSVTGLRTQALTFNLQHPPFSDALVRRAFAMATDREAFVRVTRWSDSVPATGGYVPPGIPGHGPDIGLPFDPAQARRLLAKAGFPGGKGFSTVRMVWPDWPANDDCRWLSEQWRIHLGVIVELQLMPLTELMALDRQKPPPLFFAGWVADHPDPDSFLRVGWLRHQPTWQDEVYLRLVEEARSLTDQPRRLALYRQADRMLIENACIVPLTYPRVGFMIKPWVKAFPVSALSRHWKDVIIEPH